ncbi:MAG: beta-galactosidase [Kiritimatiellaeota bacterium]|nr:beta-galactosidase [Kiritimatiellota bacterium]
MRTITKFPFMLHGGDYNPDQWSHIPGTVDEDFRLFKIAGVNAVSLGIFSWARLEPEEGKFDFSFMDDIFKRAEKSGTAIILATPSGAKPNWMAAKYPEIRRVLHLNGPRPSMPLRMEQGARHNHCPTSPIYREKCQIINRKLAERYGASPALAMWHVSNEYNESQCECPLCRAAWREWLRKKYGSLKTLNEAWWTGFWSHAFNDWEEINGFDWSIPAMVLDRKRFDTDQMIDFYLTESAPLRELTPHVPLTVNTMGTYDGLDYWKWAKVVDVCSWDGYPNYHDRPESITRAALHFSFCNDFNRSFKNGAPFLLMESCPGPTNWQQYNRLLRPGVHALKSMQAVAHGSDGVCYFQIRKGRGGWEKFHGAVIDHVGNESPRMFKEVAQVGDDLKKLAPVLGATTPAQVAIIYDWENRWILNATSGPSAFAKDYDRAVLAHYAQFWKRGIPVDILNGDSEFNASKYSLVIAPTLYMLRKGFAERVEKFVAAGGAFVATYLTGIADETDLVFSGGFPGPLKKLFGIWVEETDYLYEDERNSITGIGDGTRETANVGEVIHLEGAEAVATFTRDFYAGFPAITRNKFGKGEAWYIGAASADEYNGFLCDLYADIITTRGIKHAIPNIDLPFGVTTQLRENENGRFVFLMNFNNTPVKVEIPEGYETIIGTPPPDLPAYGFAVLKQNK